MVDSIHAGQGTAVSEEMRERLQALVDALPVPVLPVPRHDPPLRDAALACRLGQESLLAGLVKRAIHAFPPALFSWQSVVLGGQILCCSAGIIMAVLGGANVLLLVMAGLGLAIGIADIACLIYHQKYGLPTGHDSIAGAVYYIARRFFDESRSQNLGMMVSPGARALLTAAVAGEPFLMTFLGLNFPLFHQVSHLTYETLAFFRYGAAGCPVTGQQVGIPFFRLLARLFPDNV